MFKLLRLSLCCAFVALGACAPTGADDGDGDGGTDSPLPDADGDNISDEDEGRDSNLDTDEDGTPDYLDDDSDGDGIPDYREAGDDSTHTPPIDTDADGIPDFQDLDSDDNGISDADDGVEDLDGDGKGNFQDLDDDDDTLLDTYEIDGSPADPPDSDGDGTPNYQDTDSDADNILDVHERAADPDGDGTPAYLDSDADDDCISDMLEAGDADPQTFPVDSDGDGTPNFLDIDSDNDGLADGDEDANCNGMLDGGETAADDDDTDGDGVSDLVEDVAGTDPNNMNDNPGANGDFFFLVPYEDPTSPTEDTLEFRTSVQFADLYFTIDTTGSMDEEIDALGPTGGGVSDIITELTCQPTGGTCMLDSDCATGICFNMTCVEDPTAGTGCVPNLWTGIGVFDDHATYDNLVSVQSNATTTENNVPGGTGGGSAESGTEAALCVADPSHAECDASPGCAASGVGCPGFRSNAVRILIQVTDADNQCGSSCPTPAEAGMALLGTDIKFIGLYGTDDDSSGVSGTPQDMAEAIGIASGTVDGGGNPFVYEAIDANVVASTKQAVLDIVRNLPLDVTIDQADEPGDDGDALQFIDYVEVNISGTGNCTNVTPTTDTDGDTRDDAFPSLTPGTPVCWDVHPIPLNDFVPATEVPQLFIARLTVNGDGSPLDSRQVFFLIPPDLSGEPID